MLREADNDEAIYEMVAAELVEKGPRPGLWAKAFAKSHGDDAKAKAQYIEWRADQIKQDLSEEVARQRAAQNKTATREKAAGKKPGIGIAGVAIFIAVLVLIGFIHPGAPTSLPKNSVAAFDSAPLPAQTPAAASKSQDAQAEARLAELKPNWLATVNSAEFRSWMRGMSDREMKVFYDSKDPDYIASVITRFENRRH